jgi:DNA polymerase III alpha subunit (gram-positive type)
MINYYILDLETTGLKSGYNEIIEISVIRCEDRVQFTKEVKAKYPERASLDALEVCGKSFEDLIYGEDIEDVVNECNDFFNLDNSTPEGRCIVGHNIIGFDKRFLHATWEQQNKVFPANLFFDTMQMTRDIIKKAGDKSKVNLDASCDYFGITKKGTKHTAKADTRNNYFLWKALMENKSIDYIRYIKNFPHEFECILEEKVTT